MITNRSATAEEITAKKTTTGTGDLTSVELTFDDLFAREPILATMKSYMYNVTLTTVDSVLHVPLNTTVWFNCSLEAMGPTDAMPPGTDWGSRDDHAFLELTLIQGEQWTGNIAQFIASENKEICPTTNYYFSYAKVNETVTYRGLDAVVTVYAGG